MDKIFELNTVNNVKDSVGTSKVKATSPIVEVFSALSQGNPLLISRSLLAVQSMAITRLFLS